MDECIICKSNCCGILCNKHIDTKNIECSIKAYISKDYDELTIIKKIIDKYNKLYENNQSILKNVDIYKKQLDEKHNNYIRLTEHNKSIFEKKVIEMYEVKQKELMLPYKHILILQEKLLSKFIENNVSPDKAAYSVGQIMAGFKTEQKLNEGN